MPSLHSCRNIESSRPEPGHPVVESRRCGSARSCRVRPRSIVELGLIDSLVGVSEECRWPPEVVGRPIVTAARFDPLEPVQPRDRRGRSGVAAGRQSLYAVDAALIVELAPDLIVTQDLCAVCAVSSGDLASACPVGAEVLSLDPRTFGEVADSVRTLAPSSRRRRRAATDRGRDAARPSSRSRRRSRTAAATRFLCRMARSAVLCRALAAGDDRARRGVDVLGRAGEPSRSVSWEEVFALEPELVILGPCGFGADEAASRAGSLAFPCPAVAVDGDAYYSGRLRAWPTACGSSRTSCIRRPFLIR